MFEPNKKWKKVCVEVMKSIHGYKDTPSNSELDCTDYEKSGDGVQLLRVVEGRGNSSKIGVDIVVETQREVGEGIYTEAILMANYFTSASKRLIKKDENLTFISLDNKYFSSIDLITAFNSEIEKQWKSQCGSTQHNEADSISEAKNIKGTIDRLNDDAQFHVKMGWTHLLYSDLLQLYNNRNELQKTDRMNDGR